MIGITSIGGFTGVHGLSEPVMIKDDYDVAFFPKHRTQQHQFGTAGYAIMRASKHKDAAWEWLKFCVSKDGMKTAQRTPDSNSARRSHNTGALLRHRPEALGVLLRHPC